jgi:5-methyltetrahydrofolate--homocysteine methyltransferase
MVEPAIATLREYIDWTFFFHAWELRGRFPAILDHPEMGPAARDLYENAQTLLDEIIANRSLTARGVYGFWGAHSEGDDIVLETGLRLPMLRQQVEHGEERPYLSLADFVSPSPGDHLGAFAVTAGIGADKLADRYQAEGDDYRSIMVKALADRLAEAFAEYLHEVVRNEWYDDAKLPKEDLVAEKYRGIRPAYGYPACPDHSEKEKEFELLAAGRAGMELTETFSMLPAASVSGLYFAHPDAKYFAVGKIGRDQVEDYARRKGMTVDEAERWLTPNLGYEKA